MKFDIIFTMKTNLPVIVLFALMSTVFTGCLGPAPKAPRNWLVEWTGSSAAGAAAPSAPSVKFQQLEVLAPYGGTHIAVLRPDGSIAFDAFNSFAAAPASLMKGAAVDVIESSGLFSRVVRPGSSAAADCSLEATVVRLALDCRAEGRREASVALVMTLVRGRSVVSSAKGEASVPLEGGDFSAAFSRAFEGAALAALKSLEVK